MKLPNQTGRAAAAAIVLLAIALRAAVAFHDRDHLSRDPDAYRGIAAGLVDGEGYHMPNRPQPTAYRPPLYPLILSACLLTGAPNTAIAVVHILAGTLTVLFVIQIGWRLNLGRFAFLAGLAVAVDPLLVQYTARVMTETVFTFLVALLVLLGMPRAETTRQQGRGEQNDPQPSSRHPRLQSFAFGLVFGFCALCRPTIWGFAVFSIAAWILSAIRGSRLPQNLSAQAWPMLLGAALVLVPWVVRNQLVFGRPILTTTHGGYTLLLANNPVFYREVVAAPWGATWEGNSLERWQQSLNRQMAAEDPPVVGEIARDRWMKRRALDNIRRQPAMFLRACALRFAWFWNIVPQRPARDSLPLPVVWGVGLFYTFVMLAALVGLFRLLPGEWLIWRPLLLLILSFTLLHTVYWSNARMRAPVIPAVALMAVRGLHPRRKGKTADLAGHF